MHALPIFHQVLLEAIIDISDAKSVPKQYQSKAKLLSQVNKHLPASFEYTIEVHTLSQMINYFRFYTYWKNEEQPLAVSEICECTFLFLIRSLSSLCGMTQKSYFRLYMQFATDKSSATCLLNCIEEQVGVLQPDLLKRTPLILQTLYEEDVIDEETILTWHAAPPESSWLVNKVR